VLGRGGMGQVFLGHDTLLDRPVAVKFLVTLSPNERLRKRFLIEARALARVHHPNIVAIYRVGIFSGLPYLVSELIAGQSLDKVPKPMPWPMVLRIGIDLARGLAAVHSHGVLHRDLKPANVTIERET
jgi:serine/threonine protein kinase